MATKKQKTAVVNTMVFGVTLRDNPDGKLLDTVLPNGTKVKIKSEFNGWCEVKGGWVRAIFLKEVEE